MFTDKQEALINFFLDRFGFRNDEYRNQYFSMLKKVFYLDEENYYAGKPIEHMVNSFIGFLSQEYEMKSNHNLIDQQVTQKDRISASDLANFTYCPVGFSISNSFLIPDNQVSKTGTKLHEQIGLVYGFELYDLFDKRGKEKKEDLEYHFNEFITPETESFFTDISNSECVFTGHHSFFNNQFFINEQYNFIGQPDYIFQNSDGRYFVVEEKFKKDNNDSKGFFFSNHKVQLASYIHFLKEYNIDYGYLVYWYYSYENHYPEVKKCQVLLLERKESILSYLMQKHSSLQQFIKKRFYNLPESDFNPKKCANCVYISYCGHKSRRKNQVTLPYQTGYLNLFPAELPEILKKEEEDNDSGNSIKETKQK
jgi:CRISPR/Cas system-associated exonuclease Cas4 (RecB family)